MNFSFHTKRDSHETISFPLKFERTSWFTIITTCFIFTGILFAIQRPDAVPLNGKWEFLEVDPLNDLVADRTGSFDPPRLSSRLSEVIPDSMLPNPHQFIPGESLWKTIDVPSAWEQVAGIDFNGAGWYRRTIVLPREWQGAGQRTWIEFDAVATAAGVWVNGKWCGGNVGDYVRWRVEITAAAAAGKNEILVYVDELPGHITQGFLSVIAPHHGGIWQEVRMYRTGPVSLLPDGVHIDPEFTSGKVKIAVLLDQPWPEKLPFPDLKILTHPGGNENLLTGENNLRITREKENKALMYEFTLHSHRIWSPDHPNLYQARLNVPAGSSGKAEQVHQTFAFRDIRISGSTVYLNGQPLNIRSVLNWGYYPRIVSPAPPPEVVREEFDYYRSLGFNAETICLMIMPDYFYDIADQTGMLIWEEYPTWHNDFSDKEQETFRRVFPAYFRRDRHHPSIILRSISVEAGVKDQEVMAELVSLAKKSTDTPVQDNSSWFWLSNEKLTDWYGEDNYWNNDRWARHMLIDLPAKLAEMPVKPYIIGETIAGTVWPDAGALQKIKMQTPLANGIIGSDQPQRGARWPYWYPTCFESCLQVEQSLRDRYNAVLPAGKDVIRDYLLPQSERYALEFRRFQISLLYADPRYAGWTLFLGRDVPNCHSGLYDNLGRPRWQPEEWAWMNAATAPPVTVEEAAKRGPAKSLIEAAPELLRWDPRRGWAIQTETPLFYLREGYSELGPLFTGWLQSKTISEQKIPSLPAQAISGDYRPHPPGDRSSATRRESPAAHQPLAGSAGRG